MKIIANETFLQHAESHGLRPDPRQGEPRTLNYQNRFKFEIPMPQNILRRCKAIYAALLLVDDPNGVFVWRRGGTWKFRTSQDRNVRSSKNGAVASIFANAGVPNGTRGTLRIDASEQNLLYGLIYMNSIAAGCVDDDIFVIPESCDMVIYFDHDGLIILNFRNAEIKTQKVEQFTMELEKLKIPTYGDPDLS